MSFFGAGRSASLRSRCIGPGRDHPWAAFRQIPPDQSVGVFVRSPLPRVVGVGEVELHAGLFLQIPVGVKLAAIVSGDRREAFGVLRHQHPEPCLPRRGHRALPGPREEATYPYRARLSAPGRASRILPGMVRPVELPSQPLSESTF